jgi:hypothetical protein
MSSKDFGILYARFRYRYINGRTHATTNAHTSPGTVQITVYVRLSHIVDGHFLDYRLSHIVDGHFLDYRLSHIVDGHFLDYYYPNIRAVKLINQDP